MKLKKLELHNFRCFEDRMIEFDDNLNVIVGMNGAGKTSILEAAVVAIGTLLYSMDSIANPGIKKTDAHNKYFNMGSGIDVQPQYPIDITASGSISDDVVTWTRSLNGENGKTTIIDAKNMIVISKLYRERIMRGDTSLVLPVVAYYGTGRMWDFHRKKKVDTFKKNNRANGYIDCLDGTANIKLMMNWFKKMAWNDDSKNAHSPEFVAVRGAMEQCFSSITGFDDVSVEFNPETTEIEISYCDHANEVVKIAINQLSDGYKGTISLIADIAYRMAVLNPWLLEDVLKETDGVVLIDEVDLHLHPAWQQRIITDLTTIFPKVQFILTTHAPAVINSIKSDNLILLKDLEIAYLDNQVYGKDVKSVLNEIMGVSERPLEVTKLFEDFYKQLSENAFDAADETLNEIYKIRGGHDQEVAACRVKLKLERIRGGQV
ncbi:AAA family ATPase [Amedibacillus sp. YH-ame10]